MEPLWVVSVTEHVPFRDIVRLLTRERILRSLRNLQRALVAAGNAGAADSAWRRSTSTAARAASSAARRST